MTSYVNRPDVTVSNGRKTSNQKETYSYYSQSLNNNKPRGHTINITPGNFNHKVNKKGIATAIRIAVKDMDYNVSMYAVNARMELALL